MAVSVFFKTVFLMVIALQTANAEPSSMIPVKREFPLNESVNPCENFHKYVCSKVEESFKLRDDRSRHTFAFNDSAERILEAKKEFFSQIHKQKKLDKRSEQIKSQYVACMSIEDGKKGEERELKKLVGELNKIKSAKEFAKYQINKIFKGQEGLIYFDAYSNQDNPKINDIYLSLEFMNLPEHSYYLDKALMSDYQILVADFFKIVFPDLAEKERMERASKVIELEKDFIKVYPLPEIRRQRWSEKRQESQQSILKKYSKSEFSTLFQKLPKKSLVSNSVPEALEFYNSRLSDDNLSVLKDYFLYSYGNAILDDSNSEYFDKQFKFSNKYLGGPAARSDRHERCTRAVTRSFAKELDQLLIKKMFPNFPSDKFKQVAHKVRSSIINGLQKNNWLEAESRQKAILKMEKAKLYLVQPETTEEWDFLPIQNYSSKDRFLNREIYRKAQLNKKIVSLKKGANLEAWYMGPLTVNAYYDPSANKFVMPMGILQYPFFNPEGDLIENLGAVGAIIGHELGHGVDDQGSRFDEVGRLKQWMTMKDLAQFTERSKKLIEQFNKAGHNGNLTLGENIGDLVGLGFAYQAAFPEGSVPSIEDKKRLFISYARLWCGVARPKSDEEQLKTDPHALGWARINEQVKHQKAFAEAFKCRAQDKMNLPDSERVQIW